MKGVVVKKAFIMGFEMQQGFHTILLASGRKWQSTPWIRH